MNRLDNQAINRNGSINSHSVSLLCKGPWNPFVGGPAGDALDVYSLWKIVFVSWNQPFGWQSLEELYVSTSFICGFIGSLQLFFVVQGTFLSSSSWPSTSADASPRPKNRNRSPSLVGCCWGQVHSITGTLPLKPCSSFIDVNKFLAVFIRTYGS